jgi:hypothetical protein
MILPAAAVELALVPWPDPSLQGWLGTLFLGGIASALAFVVYSRALRELDASLVGAYLNLDPIVGVLTAVILLGEALGVWQVVGGVVALAGMWLASVERGAQPRRRVRASRDHEARGVERWSLRRSLVAAIMPFAPIGFGAAGSVSPRVIAMAMGAGRLIPKLVEDLRVKGGSA